MDANLKKTALTLIVIGVVTMPLAPLAGGLVESDSIRRMAALATTFGFGAFLFGCSRLALAKGQPWWYGLLGLFNLIGLAVLWFVIPDRSAQT